MLTPLNFSKDRYFLKPSISLILQEGERNHGVPQVNDRCGLQVWKGAGVLDATKGRVLREIGE